MNIKKTNKGQVSIEFILIASFVAGGFLLASSAIFNFINEARTQQETEALGEIGNSIFSEVVVASVVQDNYERHFRLPSHAAGVEYDIFINWYEPPISNNSEIILKFVGSERNKIIFLQDVDVKGLTHGCNTLTKKEGIITIMESETDKC
ncbi:MAG: hypothetical protein ACOCUR_01485 [Nanoarchaeota archaeon]